MEDPIPYPCPYCHNRQLETVEKVPFVRGFVLAYRMGYKIYIGCCPCVRRRVLRETGLSSLLGWFSITALLVNPFLITYGLVRAGLVSPDAAGVKAQLARLGVPDTSVPQVNVLAVGYGLAAAMIAADGTIEPAEVETAVEIGQRVLDGFDRAAFAAVVEDYRNLPSTRDMAAVLAPVLDPDGKKLLCEYLAAIASADGDVDPAEEAMLVDVMQRLGLADRQSAPE